MVTRHNPEDDLLVPSLSSCHMLWYLRLCSEAGVIVFEYLYNASGIMVETSNDGGHFAEITLNPIVIAAENLMLERTNELHN